MISGPHSTLLPHNCLLGPLFAPVLPACMLDWLAWISIMTSRLTHPSLL
jgi:hypothetical protein